MTQQQILEGNRLIVRFMNVPTRRGAGGGTLFMLHGRHCRYDGLEYHSYWEWLMPVVEKIELMYAFTSLKNSWGSRNDRELLYWFEITKYDPNGDIEYANTTTDDSKIKAVYTGIIHFITWYNQNKYNERN